MQKDKIHRTITRTQKGTNHHTLKIQNDMSAGKRGEDQCAKREKQTKFMDTAMRNLDQHQDVEDTHESRMRTRDCVIGAKRMCDNMLSKMTLEQTGRETQQERMWRKARRWWLGFNWSGMMHPFHFRFLESCATVEDLFQSTLDAQNMFAEIFIFSPLNTIWSKSWSSIGRLNRNISISFLNCAICSVIIYAS